MSLDAVALAGAITLMLFSARAAVILVVREWRGRD